MMHLKHLKHCSPFPGNGEQWYTVQMVNNALNDAFPCKCYQWEMVHHLVYHFLREMRHFLRKCMHFSRKCVIFHHFTPLFTIFTICRNALNESFPGNAAFFIILHHFLRKWYTKWWKMSHFPRKCSIFHHLSPFPKEMRHLKHYSPFSSI